MGQIRVQGQVLIRVAWMIDGMNKPTEFIAHVRETDRQARQSLENHLRGVGGLSEQFANKFGLSIHGLLIGMLHDLGKYSTDFQRYILSATGLLNQDVDEEYVDAKGLKGKIDHSTCGAQVVWSALSTQGQKGQFAGVSGFLCVRRFQKLADG